MEEEELLSDDEFLKRWRKRQRKLRGIVAMKGLPYTWKTRLAELVGEWAACPVLCMDDFLGYKTDNKVADYFSPPTRARDVEEVERHHKHAFTTLCAVVRRHLYSQFSSSQEFGNVVVKSRLNSTFELDQLVDLTHIIELRKGRKYPLVIIECQMRNEFRWRQRFKFFAKGEVSSSWYREPSGWKDTEKTMHDYDSWYRPMMWKEMVKARDDYVAHAPAWDRHLQNLLEGFDDDPPTIRRLVVDPLCDLSCTPTQKFLGDLTDDGFIDAVKFLLLAGKEELVNRNPYVVEFAELRRYLFDKKLSAAALKGRRKYLCLQGDCVFKYWEALEDDRKHEAEFCRVCEKQVSGPAYTCHFCILTLHKSCAERIDIKSTTLPSFIDTDILTFFYYYTSHFPKNHACDSCIEAGRDFSNECGSCLFQSHLKCHLAPTIINNKCHQHFLSIQLHKHSFFCKACGVNYTASSYGCKRCALYYHLHCASLAAEVKHEHGGHEHVMKLMYSRDGMEPEEDYWCDFCYHDMDPQGWFYSCQECSYYATCLDCAGGYDKTYEDMISYLGVKP